MTWNKLFINKQNVERSTDRAVLVKMPKNSVYNGWKFWHPAKLVREEGGEGYFLSLSFSDDWLFRLFKTYKVEKDPQMKVAPEDVIEAFAGSDESIRMMSKQSSESYLNVIEPEPINKKIEVDESLKR